jgi:S-DNA-T family DNA segregation ATPase FtsK/SpoIIIE
VRFTLLDAGDVEVVDGTPLAEARESLVRLTGVAALRDAPLAIDGRPLPAGLPAGVEPWVEGSCMAVGDASGLRAHASASWPGRTRTTGRRRPARRWVVALAGPRAGLAWPAPRFARARLLARAAALQVRWVRRAGSGRRSEPAGPAELAHGEVLTVTRLPRDRPGSGGSGRPGSLSVGTAATWLVPALGGVAAAVLWHAPAFAVLSLVGVLPALLAARPGRPAWAPDAARVSARDAARLVGPGVAAHPDREAGETPAPGTWRTDAARGLALTGERATTLGAARVLVADVLGEPSARLVLVVDRRRRPDWRWLRWCSDRVAVLDAQETAAAGLAATREGTLRTATLVVVDSAAGTTLALGDVPRLALAGDRPPAWCATAVAATRLASGGPAWAEGRARALAATARRGGGADTLPDVVGLADLPVHGPGEWAVPIGVGPSGPVHVDLVADGPHALVAGTTGAGKSELLQTLVLALARRHGPDRLALVLVDFKGGAGLGACRDLPHVAGLVTDLDTAATARALEGLRAEVRSREALLASAGVPDLEALRARDGAAPPRVVVVVDELLALRDDLPGTLPALVRLATQGRALGLHLVLATQRPAGALDPQVRANVALRACLRVADPADSLDVVGTPDAAALPSDRPGRALLRVGERDVVTLQTAWAALAPRPTGARWASPWPPTGSPATRPAERPGAGGAQDQVAALVAALSADATEAADAAPRGTDPARGLRPARATVLWRPPLPEVVGLDELERYVGAVPEHLGAPPRVTSTAARSAGDPRAVGAAGAALAAAPLPGLRIGLVDRPVDRATEALVWRPGAGPLVLAGPPASGRTTGLRAVAQAAVAQGRAVHLVGEDLAGPLLGTRHGAGWLPAEAVGTVATADDPRHVLRLVELLCAERRDDVLLVDDLGAVLRSLRLMPRGVGEDVLGALLAARVPLALAGDDADLRALARPAVLVRLAEVPPGSPGDGRGRADHEWTPGPGPGGGTVAGLACRLAVPAREVAVMPRGDGTPARRLRLAPLPDTVRVADLRPAPDAPTSVVLGLGGDDGGPVRVALDRGLLVLGPSGSGRSAVLRSVLAQVASARAADADAIARLPALGSRAGAPSPLTAAATTPMSAAAPGVAAGPTVLVVDDVDVLTRDRPDLDVVLADLVAAGEATGARTRSPASALPSFVLAARTDRVATVFRGAVAALRASGPVLVLDPLSPGSADAAGTDLSRACDPRRPRGRAVLVDRGRVVPVQVADA